MAIPLRPGVYTIQQKSNRRFVDAHEIAEKDFALVTREAQNDDTQRWIVTPSDNDTYTIQQKSNGRFVDAHEIAEKDFALVTRTAQNNDTQKWIVTPSDNDTYTIQQKSNGRFVDAHEIAEKDFALVTRTAQNDDTQRWLISLWPPPDRIAAPQNILEIQYNNPAFTLTTDLANSIAGGKFPQGSGKEWKQVLEPSEDYDLIPVGATGWVIDPKLVTKDFPFSHPFGFDWEFALALDQPTDNPTKYTFLLAPGNSGPEDNADDPADSPNARAIKLGIPVPSGGFLGVEWDRGHVPASFRQEVREGDRVAVFGRWILDCGHEPFRTEIHPPLLMAVAGTQKESDGSLGTRVLFTSRPYLVGQKYTVDTDKIYDDAAEDDGHFYDHLLKELVKVNENIGGIPIGSLLVEAHPKIKSFPFLGAHIVNLRIRPPSPTGIHGTGSPFKRLTVSFQFTVRNGCAVQVTQTAKDTVDVFISFSGQHPPPPLPNRNVRPWSKDELNDLDPEAGAAYLDAEVLSGAVQLVTGGIFGAAVVEGILERGIETDEYEPLKMVNVLDSQNAVKNVFADSIPAGRGVTQDDNQPYPIYGWLEVKWVDVAVVHP